MGVDNLAHHELRHAHADAKGFGFVAAGNPQPSLLESTMTGWPFSLGLNTRSQLAEKLLQSTRAKPEGRRGHARANG